MTTAPLVLVLGLCAIAATGVVLALRARGPTAAPRRWASTPPVEGALERAARVRECLVDRLGPVGAFLVLVGAALPPIAICCHVLGVVVQHAPVTDVDLRLHSWFVEQNAATPWLRGPAKAVNRIANWPETWPCASCRRWRWGAQPPDDDGSLRW